MWEKKAFIGLVSQACGDGISAPFPSAYFAERFSQDSPLRDIVVPKQKASEGIAGKDVADGTGKRRRCLHPTRFQPQNLSLLRHMRDACHHAFWRARTAFSKHSQYVR